MLLLQFYILRVLLYVAQVLGVNDGTDRTAGEWRVPNIAELAVIGKVVSTSGTGGVVNYGIGNQSVITANADVYLPAGSTTIEGTVVNLNFDLYWSTTTYCGVCGLWCYANNMRRPGCHNCSQFYHPVRCVRTME
ncbi:MAG: DUF1566 domain-containing protein [Prevotellaceae bacterium]|nr:DUF1566 domain-containing protein [Prevotellaceae bacterium]